VICVFLGVVCLLSAVGLVVYNRWEADRAEDTAQALLADVQSIMDEKPQEQFLHEDTVNLPNHLEKRPTEMATVKVGGYDCIGILSVPVLELELPVLTDWSYEKLKKAPCHYYGTYYEKDFVIAAHNYQSHFGRLSELRTGDIVFFTDVNGAAYYYEVVLLETLPKDATEEMITAGFDLSLYTCTPGGASRVTVRCNAVKDGN
jgi:sortase A